MEQLAGPDLVLVVGTGVVLAIAGVIIAWLRTRGGKRE
jgi:hypothetical protein